MTGFPQAQGLVQTPAHPSTLSDTEQAPASVLHEQVTAALDLPQVFRLPHQHLLIVPKALERHQKVHHSKSRGSFQPELTHAQNGHHPVERRSGSAECMVTHTLSPHERGLLVSRSLEQRLIRCTGDRPSHEKIMPGSPWAGELTPADSSDIVPLLGTCYI